MSPVNQGRLRLHNRGSRTERTRAALIAAGRRLFSKQPADAVTIDDIVRAAKVGKGSFYNHFADRDVLLRAISSEIRASVEHAVDLANDGVDDPARRVARAMCVYLRYAVEDPERAGVLARIQSGVTSLTAPLNRGLVGDIAKGLAAARFSVATLEAGVLCVLGVTQIAPRARAGGSGVRHCRDACAANVRADLAGAGHRIRGRGSDRRASERRNRPSGLRCGRSQQQQGRNDPRKARFEACPEDKEQVDIALTGRRLRISRAIALSGLRCSRRAPAFRRNKFCIFAARLWR